MDPITKCKFNFDELHPDYRSRYPFKKEDRFIFMGEITNMPSHGVFIDIKSGKSYCGFHIDNFVETTD